MASALGVVQAEGGGGGREGEGEGAEGRGGRSRSRSRSQVGDAARRRPVAVSAAAVDLVKRGQQVQEGCEEDVSTRRDRWSL